MKTQYLLLSLACSAPALLSCSMPVQQTESAMRIEPVLRIRNSDSSARGFYQLGRYYQGQNRYVKAAEAYRSAIRHDPDYIDAHSALGVIYSTLGKYDDAIAEFTSVLKTAPQLAYIQNNLGYAHYLQGDHAAAVAAFEQAIALEPQNLHALNNLGLAHQKMGDAEKSRLAFSQAAETPAATGAFMALAADGAAASTPVASVQLPALSSTSVSLTSPAPAVSLALMPAATSTLAPAADGNDANLVLAHQEQGSLVKFVTRMGNLFWAPVPVAALAPAATDSTPNQSNVFVMDMESSAPAVSLAGMSAAASAPTQVANGNDANVAVAPQEKGSVLKLDILLGNLFSAAAPAAADSSPKQGKAFRLEVANGNGVTGFARKMGDKLTRNGLPKPQLTNIKPYQQRSTLIQYRDGFHDEAIRVSHMLQTPPAMQSESGLRKGTDVRLVLGTDVVGKDVLLLSQYGDSVRLAESGSDAGKIVEVAMRLARKLAGYATQFL